MSWIEEGLRLMNEEMFREIIREQLLPQTVTIAQRARAFGRLLNGTEVVYTREVIVEGVDPVYVCRRCDGGEPCVCNDKDQAVVYEKCRRTPGWEWVGLDVRWEFDRCGDNPLPRESFHYNRVQLAHPDTEEVVYDLSCALGNDPVFVPETMVSIRFGCPGTDPNVVHAAVVRLPQLGPVEVPCARFHRPGRRCLRCWNRP